MWLQTRAGAAALSFLSVFASTASLGADQSVLGAGNQVAQQLAARSPLVSSAVALITQRVAQIADRRSVAQQSME
jgi:hypothetical protein